VREPALGFVTFQFLAGAIFFIAPAAFAQEGVPYQDFLLARAAPMREAPFENLFVGPSL
jgi:hypothetical protein